MDTPTDAKHRRAEARWQTLEAQMGVLGGLRDYADGVAQVAHFIAKVRAAPDLPTYHDLQLELLDAIRDAETRARAARVALGHGRPPYTMSIDELRRSVDACMFVAWHRRVAQLRGVGDAIAWHILEFHRGYLAALAGGPGSGYAVEKSGLAAELRAFEDSWARGVPAVLTTVTRCLRVGDLVEVPTGARPVIREVKIQPEHRRGRSAQSARRARTEATIAGLRAADAQRVVLCSRPIRHQLGVIAEHLDHVAPGGLDLLRLTYADVLLFDTATKFDPAMRTSWRDAYAKIDERVRADLKQEWLQVHSFERVDLEDFNAPYAVYPFAPELCAALMFGYLQISVCLNLSMVMDVLAHRGFNVVATIPMSRSSALLLVDGHMNKLRLPHWILGRVIHEAMDPESLADLAVTAHRYAFTEHPRDTVRKELLPAFEREHELWR